jgi:hypothetical protein
MGIPLYCVDADNVNQRGIVLGPGFCCFTLMEAEEKMAQWEQDPTLTNVRLSVKDIG